MNSNKEAETQTKAFAPSEKPEEKIRKKKKCYSVNEYKNNVKNLWKDCRGRIFRGVVVSAAAISICAAISHFELKPGYEVYVDGENIGWVTDKDVVYDAIAEARNDVKNHLGENVPYDKEPVFVRRIVSGDKLSSKEVLKDNMLDNIDTLVKGYAVYINGEAVFGVSEHETAEQILAQYKSNVAGEITDDMSAEFCETIEIKKAYIGVSMLETRESAMDVLAGTDKPRKTYTVQKNDTLRSISEKFNVSVDEILTMNTGVAEPISEGLVLTLEKATPLLSVRCVQTVSVTEPVPFKVEKIEDETIYEGKTEVAQEGVNGSRNVIAVVTTVNGVETQKEVLSTETITEPVSRIEKIGTKERPSTTGSGTFTNPSSGVLSSRYGQRWDRSHNGIDIAGQYNSDIKAADGGIVTYAGWMDGYGNYIIINHENGYQTAYGHCASLSVSVGDRVSKGDVIAKMGSTGRSTGTHLHFEVKKDGVFVNPLEYVGY